MMNPFALTLAAQGAALRYSAGMLAIMVGGCAKMMEGQTRLLQGHVARRCLDVKRHEDALPALGPDLKDRYGRRCHDVDVEKI